MLCNSGTVNPRDVVSPDLVEPTYRASSLAEPFSAQLATAVVAYAEARLQVSHPSLLVPKSAQSHYAQFSQCLKQVHSLAIAFLQDVPEGIKLRILEVGSGAAGAMAAVMAALASDSERVEFTCTASTPQLLAHARTLIASRYPSTDFKLLDIQQDIGTQVLAAGGLPRCSVQGVLCAARLLHDRPGVPAGNVLEASSQRAMAPSA